MLKGPHVQAYCYNNIFPAAFSFNSFNSIQFKFTPPAKFDWIGKLNWIKKRPGKAKIFNLINLNVILRSMVAALFSFSLREWSLKRYRVSNATQAQTQSLRIKLLSLNECLNSEAQIKFRHQFDFPEKARKRVKNAACHQSIEDK